MLFQDSSSGQPAPCSMLSGTELACITPEVIVPDFVFYELIARNPNPVRLIVYLEKGSDVLNNRNTTFEFPFRVYENPTVITWDPSIQDFEVNKGQDFILIYVRTLSL